MEASTRTRIKTALAIFLAWLSTHCEPPTWTVHAVCRLPAQVAAAYEPTHVHVEVVHPHGYIDPDAGPAFPGPLSPNAPVPVPVRVMDGFRVDFDTSYADFVWYDVNGDGVRTVGDLQHEFDIDTRGCQDSVTEVNVTVDLEPTPAP
jgi:hypothetical protein